MGKIHKAKVDDAHGEALNLDEDLEGQPMRDPDYNPNEEPESEINQDIPQDGRVGQFFAPRGIVPPRTVPTFPSWQYGRRPR